MDLAKQFKTDDKKEIQGVWIGVGSGAELLIARKGNRRYNDKLKLVNKERSVQRRVQLDTLPEEESVEIMAEIMAETILLGWRGIQDAGEEIEYSVATAKSRLIEYKDFRKLVDELSEEQALFREEVRKESSKNSKKS